MELYKFCIFLLLLVLLSLGFVCASNPIGWATLGAIGLVAVGSALLFYSNDLNKVYSS